MSAEVTRSLQRLVLPGDRHPAPPKANFDTMPPEVLGLINSKRVEALVERRLENEDAKYADKLLTHETALALGANDTTGGRYPSILKAQHTRKREEVQRSFPISIHAGNPESRLFRGTEANDLRIIDPNQLDYKGYKSMPRTIRRYGAGWGTWTNKQKDAAVNSGATFYATVPRALGPGY